MRKQARILGIVLGALVAAACGDNGEGSAGTAGSGGAGSGGSGGTSTSTVTGVVVTRDQAEDPVQGATVAVFGTQISATTNASGQFTLQNVPNGEVFFTTAANGNWGIVDFYDVPDETGGGIDLGVIPDSEITLLAEALERPIDPAKGAVDITYEDAAGGETGTISASSDDPFTFDLAEFPVVQDTVIADDEGYADLIFTSVDPSSGITAAVTGAAGTTNCQVDQSAGTMYPIIAGSITIVYAWCTPVP